MNILTFEELEVWKQAKEIRKKFIIIVKSFPHSEVYNLADQIRRASRSATSNIAEGYGRFHHQENIQFCRQSRGSLYELIDHLTSAFDEGYINEQIQSETKVEIYNCIKVLNGYIENLKKAKKEATENKSSK